MRAFVAAPLVAALLAGRADAQGPDDLVLPEGLEATVWADSPLLHDPTAIDLDARGRVWLTEAVDYRRFNERNARPEHSGGDRVVILEDTDGDGRADSSKTFVQDPELVAPLGICVLDGTVVVSCSPSIFVYTDDDGDDVPDRREVLLTGFGGRDHDHGVHSIVPGPDGRWYMAIGNAGPRLVTDRAGWTLRSGNVDVGGGPAPTDDKPGLQSDDGRVWTGGLMLRLEPDGTGLEVLAHNFRNPYEIALDSFGNAFTSDNDDDGNECCRTLWILEGGNHGYFSADGSRFWPADRRPHQSVRTAHWHQDDPGVAPAGTIDGSGGPTGVAVYEGELLAPWIGGAVLDADAGRNRVWIHRPKPVGAGFELEPDVLVAARASDGTGDDRARWFRPSDVAVAPDGAVFVADWWDPVVGGHLTGDPDARGRILRIAPRGAEPRVPAFDVSSLDGAVAALRSPAVSVRELGARALVERGADALDALGDLAEDGDERLRARALWVAARLGAPGAPLLERALDDLDPELRVTALRAARLAGLLSHPRLLALAADPAPAVRREVALALADVELDECADALLALARGFDGSDRTYLEALGVAAAGREEAVYDLFAGELGEVPDRWDARFAGLAWRLHPAGSVAGLRARALDARLPLAERRRTIDALGLTPDRAAAEAMMDVALVGPADTRELGAWWVEHDDGGLWRAYDLARELGGPDARLAWSSGPVENGAVPFDVPLEESPALWLVVEDGPEGNACDWADWIDLRLVGPAGERRLAELGWTQAEAEWGSVHVDANCVGDPMRIDGEQVSAGIGTHAYSAIRFELPEGYERVVGRGGVDVGGTRQAGHATRVEFRVLLEEGAVSPRLANLERTLLEAGDAEARLEAGRELAADGRGGMRLVHLAARGALDEPTRAALAEALYKSPDLAVRALASAHFPRPWADGAKVPPVAELVALPGDAARGRELFFDERAQCSTCHVVERDGVPLGRSIGPELTRVREKYGPAELFDAILNPSAGIAFGYDTWTVVDADGRVTTGFLLADGDDLVLKDTRGERVAIPADEVVERVRQTTSTMPEGLALGLAPDELADVVAFLREDPDAAPERGEEVALFDGATLAGWTWFTPDGTPVEDTWSVRDGVLVCAGTPAGYLRTTERFTNFELTLEWRFDPELGPGNSGVLLRVVGEDRVWPESIEAQLQSGNAGDIWNIGEVPMEADPERTSGRHTGRAQPSSEHALGEWNCYRITLDRGRLRLEVNGVLQNTAAWCRERPGWIALQSEGAHIEFRDLRLVLLRR